MWIHTKCRPGTKLHPRRIFWVQLIYISWELEGAIKLTLHLFSQLLLYSTGVQWYKFGRPSNPVPKNRTQLALANSFQSGIHNFCCTCLDMDLGVCWLPQNAAFHLLYIGHLIQQDHSDLGREVHCRRNGVMETWSKVLTAECNLAYLYAHRCVSVCWCPVVQGPSVSSVS